MKFLVKFGFNALISPVLAIGFAMPVAAQACNCVKAAQVCNAQLDATAFQYVRPKEPNDFERDDWQHVVNDADAFTFQKSGRPMRFRFHVEATLREEAYSNIEQPCADVEIWHNYTDTEYLTLKTEIIKLQLSQRNSFVFKTTPKESPYAFDTTVQKHCVICATANSELVENEGSELENEGAQIEDSEGILNPSEEEHQSDIFAVLQQQLAGYNGASVYSNAGQRAETMSGGEIVDTRYLSERIQQLDAKNDRNIAISAQQLQQSIERATGNQASSFGYSSNPLASRATPPLGVTKECMAILQYAKNEMERRLLQYNRTNHNIVSTFTSSAEIYEYGARETWRAYNMCPHEDIAATARELERVARESRQSASSLQSNSNARSARSIDPNTMTNSSPSFSNTGNKGPSCRDPEIACMAGGRYCKSLPICGAN